MVMVKGPDFKILGILSKLTQNNINKDVLETEIIALSGLSESETRNRLNELEWFRLAKEALPRASRPEFRLWNVTEKGLKELSDQNAG
jgi:hypothetical protein